MTSLSLSSVMGHHWKAGDQSSLEKKGEAVRIIRRTGLLRNRGGQLGRSEILWRCGYESLVVLFDPGVSWHQVASSHKKTGTEQATGCVQPESQP